MALAIVSATVHTPARAEACNTGSAMHASSWTASLHHNTDARSDAKHARWWHMACCHMCTSLSSLKVRNANLGANRLVQSMPLRFPLTFCHPCCTPRSCGGHTATQRGPGLQQTGLEAVPAIIKHPLTCKSVPLPSNFRQSAHAAGAVTTRDTPMPREKRWDTILPGRCRTQLNPTRYSKPRLFFFSLATTSTSEAARRVKLVSRASSDTVGAVCTFAQVVCRFCRVVVDPVGFEIYRAFVLGCMASQSCGGSPGTCKQSSNERQRLHFARQPCAGTRASGRRQRRLQHVAAEALELAPLGIHLRTGQRQSLSTSRASAWNACSAQAGESLERMLSWSSADLGNRVFPHCFRANMVGGSFSLSSSGGASQWARRPGAHKQHRGPRANVSQTGELGEGPCAVGWQWPGAHGHAGSAFAALPSPHAAPACRLQEWARPPAAAAAAARRRPGAPAGLTPNSSRRVSVSRITLHVGPSITGLRAAANNLQR